ncbi:MAG: molybdenum cofactor guanylyltransferase [Phycisphaerae bacterium]|nr:molybdenum cofactor guanylyltransferase [Phycisphaerae bacterium]
MLGETIGILVGGQSSRMGRPKALIEVEGGTLLERTVLVAKQASHRVVLLGDPPFELPVSLRDIEVWPDRFDDVGPIAGLDALLQNMDGRYGVLVSCDMPYLAASLLKWLSSTAHILRSDAVVCHTQDTSAPIGVRIHPCCAAYGAHIADKVADAIEQEQYGLCDLLKSLKVHPHLLSGDNARWVENWNVPSDVIADEGPPATAPQAEPS